MGAYTLTPNATAANTFTLVVGATLHECLATDADGKIAQCPTGGAVSGRANCTTFTKGASESVTTVDITIVAGGLGSTTPAIYIGGVLQWTGTPYSGIGTSTQTWTSGDLSQADIDALEIYLESSNGGLGTRDNEYAALTVNTVIAGAGTATISLTSSSAEAEVTHNAAGTATAAAAASASAEVTHNAAGSASLSVTATGAGSVTTGWTSDNLRALMNRPDRKLIMQVLIEGFPEIICTAKPPDQKAKTQALSLDGGDYAYTAVTSSLVTTGDFTFVAWANPTNFTTIRELFSWIKPADTEGIIVYLEITTGEIKVIIDGTTVATGLTCTAGLQHMIAVSLGGTTGLQVRTVLWTVAASGAVTRATSFVSAAGSSRSTRVTNWATIASSAVLGAGALPPTVLVPWLGTISYAAIYDRAFTTSEVERVAYRILDAHWPSAFWTSLQAQWNCEEGTGTTVADSKAGAFPLTFAAAAAAPSWTAAPAFTITYRDIMGAPSASEQSLEPRAARTSVSGLSFVVLDSDDWLTSRLSIVAQAVRQKSAYVFLGVEGCLESEYQVIFAGAVESIDPLVGRGYEIRLGDALRFAKSSFPLGKCKLAAAALAADASVQVDSLYGFAATTGAEQAGGANPAGYLKIDDEIIRYTNVATGPLRFTSLTRGVLGTTAANHSNGATVQEIFVGTVLNPIDWLLAFLLSGTGDYTNHATYDVFCRFAATSAPTTTDGRGAAMSLADIDVTSIVAIATARWSTYDIQPIIMDTIDDLKQWIEEQILKPLGAFFYVRADGRLSVGSWHAPTASATLDASVQVRPVPAIGYGDVANSLQVRYDFAASDGEYDNVVAYEETTSGRRHGRLNPIKIDSVCFRTNDISGAALAPTPATIFGALWTLLTDRFADPPYPVRITVGLVWFPLEIGGGVTYQHAHVPDLVAGARGLTGVTFQVVAKRPDWKRSRLELTIMRAD